MTLSVGVLCSGNGTNLQALIDASSAKSIDANISLVICNIPEARALARAEKAGIPHRLLSHKNYANRASFDQALVTSLKEAKVDLVVLAGFMRLLTPTFIDAFQDRIINVHPSLLPTFPGMDAVGQALAYGSTITGCTVHLVDGGTDTGSILAQAAVAIRDDDTSESLSSRIHPLEHRLLVDVVRWFCDDRVQITRENGVSRPRVTVRDRPRSIGLDVVT